MFKFIYQLHFIVVTFSLFLLVGCMGSSSSSGTAQQEQDTPPNNSQPREDNSPAPRETPSPERNNEIPNENSADSDNIPNANNRSLPIGKLPAFPGAEGFAAYATGGRGGRVIKVTNLNASGVGSLQAALNRNEPRIIIFDVSGVITADVITIPYGNVTIAGQTAPGAGITIEGRLYGAYDFDVQNIIIRHIRVRPPIFNNQTKGNQFDAIQLSRNSNVILDHVSMSFGVDETLDLYSAKDVTIQWCTIEQSATNGHPKGNHNYGLINGPDGGRVSILKNLFAHHNRRAPSVSSGPTETINNVIYNVKDGWLHSGNRASGQHIVSNNYFRRGPSSEMTPFFLDAGNAGKRLGYYINNNYIDDPANFSGVLDPWAIKENHPSQRYLCTYFRGGNCEKFSLDARPSFANNSDYFTPNEISYQNAFDDVLAHAGAFPRDTITNTTVQDVRTRSGEWGARIPGNLLNGLTANMPLLDTDDDGMPDNWEIRNGLDSSDASDQHNAMATGYPAIEQYINEIADSLIK